MGDFPANFPSADFFIKEFFIKPAHAAKVYRENFLTATQTQQTGIYPDN